MVVGGGCDGGVVGVCGGVCAVGGVGHIVARMQSTAVGATSTRARSSESDCHRQGCYRRAATAVGRSASGGTVSQYALSCDQSTSTHVASSHAHRTGRT